jgi:hypothetical protein
MLSVLLFQPFKTGTHAFDHSPSAEELLYFKSSYILPLELSHRFPVSTDHLLMMEADAQFLKDFHTGVLPFEQWTHASHIRMAHLVCKSSKDFDEALARIRAGIQHFNGLHAAKLTVGFHETMTYLWTALVWNATRDWQGSVSSDAASFISQHPALMDSSVWKQHYTPALMFSPDAKRGYLPPDLQPISVV